MTLLDWKEELKTICPSEHISFEEPMSRHTSFRIGGPAECYVVPKDAEELKQVILFAKANAIPFTVIGNGTNLLVSDEGIRGIVIRMEDGTFGETGTDGDRVIYRADAGVLFSSFAKAVVKLGYSELAYATGIPGSVGGAVVMNAGAYGGEVKDTLRSVTVLTKDGEIVERAAEELQLSYRHSNLSEKEEIVISAVFALKMGSPEEALSMQADYTARRKDKQPLEYPSAGSTFKRPEGYFAGKLIEDCGLRGFQIGGAQVSEKHCGFVINKADATAEDVMQLIGYVQRTVSERFGVVLEPEVRFLGF